MRWLIFARIGDRDVWDANSGAGCCSRYSQVTVGISTDKRVLVFVISDELYNCRPRDNLIENKQKSGAAGAGAAEMEGSDTRDEVSEVS